MKRCYSFKLRRALDRKNREFTGIGTFCALFFLFTCTQIEFPTEDTDIGPVQVGPRITLSGPDPYYLNIGDTYVEPGAIAYDSTDGDLTASIYIDKTPGDISTLVEQQYTVLYAVKNSKEESDSVFRTVIVQKSEAGDYSKPVITLLGDNPALVETGDTYTDAGATAEDAVDGNLTSQIQTFDAVINTAQLDTFQVWYMVLDNAGNVAYEIREVYVVASSDREPPVIDLEGPNPINLVVGYPYKEYGATAYDSVDGDLTSDIVIDANEVNTDAVGIYSVYYRVSDQAGNEAVEIRTVNVALVPDTKAPVITLLGFNPDTHVVNLPYDDSGATALDDIDGDITDRIVVTGSVDIATFGIYTLQYNVSDQAGNAAAEKTRTVVVADTVKPVVTVNNPNPVNIQVGIAYVERGATAVDNYDGDLTHLLDTNATEVNTSVVGRYHVYYTVTDNAGNTGQGIRVVNVLSEPDTEKPVITLSGANPMNLYVGDTFTEPGYTATDDIDGDITNNVVVTGDVNTAVAGTYTLHYNVSDQAGNAADEKTRTVSVTNAPDTEKPVITLAGANPMSITVGDNFTEPGYTATDNVDGDITSEVVVTGNVNTAVAGTYTLRYNVSDQAGNAADEKTRTVNVTSGPDTEKPVITLAGANPMTVSVGGTYTEPGYTAVDNFDGDITSEVVVTGNVNTAVEGTYTLRYNVSDQAGNAADEKTRTVNVTNAPDTTKPVITLSGANPMDLNVGDHFTEPGYTATDDVDGEITSDVVVTGTVNTAVAGTYTRRYNVSDQAGNAADEKTRTVNVTNAPDTTKPVITLTGANPMNLNVGDNFTEPGYTATDNVDGNITNNVVVTGTVNTAVAGTYTRRYNVSDQAGNAADEKTRTVNVTSGPDTEKPVITLTGANPMNLNVGDNFTEPGYTATDNVDGDITNNVVVTGTVNTAVAGTYTRRYNVSDQAGNAADEKTRTVNVTSGSDTEKPVITLTGANPMNLNVGDTFIEPGYTATDNVDGDITNNVVVTGTVNTAVAGTYTRRYNVSDQAGNAADEKTRTVNVNAIGTDLMWEDFESGTNRQTTIAAQNFSATDGLWFGYNDQADGGQSTIDPDPVTDTGFATVVASSTGYNSSKGLHVTFTLQNGPSFTYPYSAVCFCVKAADQYYNFTNMESFKFRAKGSGKIRVYFETKRVSEWTPATDAWGHLGASITLTSSWQQFTITTANIAPPPDSPQLAAGVKWEDPDVRDQVTSICFETEGVSGNVIELYLDEIETSGMSVSDIGK